MSMGQLIKMAGFFLVFIFFFILIRESMMPSYTGTCHLPYPNPTPMIAGASAGPICVAK